MDGKESTLSASAESSSPANAPTGRSNTANASTTKSGSGGASGPSSRPSSSGSKTTKRTSPLQKPPSMPTESEGPGTAKSDSGSKAASSPKPSGGLNDVHARSDEHKGEEKRDTSDRKRRRNASKSHDHLREPLASSGRKSPSPSAFTFAARTNCSDDSGRTKLSKQDPRANRRHNEGSYAHSGISRTNKPVIPPSSGRLNKASKLALAE